MSFLTMENEVLFDKGFVAFLPSDNEGIKNPESQAALQVLNEDLSVMLRLPDQKFWEVVKSQPTLHVALDSYLRFRRRAFDASDDADLTSSRPLNELSRRVFFLMMRLVTVPEKSSVSSRQKQADWLYDQWITDVPKIFDLCVLYGKENPQLMTSLLQSIYELQPKCLDDLQEMVPDLENNLCLLQERCYSSISHIRQGNEMGLLGWTDVLKYVLDVCANLSAFADLYPEGGRHLMHNSGSLLRTLASIHDILLPQFDDAVRTVAIDSEEVQDLVQQGHLIMAALQKTAFALLKATYLRVDDNATSDTSDQTLIDRGQQLMNVIMSFAQLDEKDVSFSLLHRMNERFHLGDCIIEAIECGSLSLDDAQFDYLNMLVQSKSRPTGLRKMTKSEKAPVHLTSQPSSSQAPTDFQRGTLLSKISEIKEVLPDHGDGFLERCLREFGMDTEKVIAHLLDGTLPSNLAKLDRNMPMQSTSDAAHSFERLSTSTQNGASSQYPIRKQFLLPDSVGPGWNAMHNEDPPQTKDVKSWAQVTVGAQRKKVDRSTARVLDQSGSDIRQIVIRQANELLADAYEDEYDDSYDDLGTHGGADGQADVEGDDADRPKEKSRKPYYVKDGKIYHAPREGAVAVTGLGNAQTTATRRDEEIHGLGRGGNLSAGVSSSPAPAAHPRGRGRGRGGRGRSTSHHRKERNLKKQGF